MFSRGVDALLGKTFDAVLPERGAAVVRLSSVDMTNRTVVLFVLDAERAGPKRLVYDLGKFARMLAEEWVESCRP